MRGYFSKLNPAACIRNFRVIIRKNRNVFGKNFYDFFKLLYSLLKFTESYKSR